MDYEKAYKEAMRAMQLRVEVGIIDRRVAESVFPQLAESEGERMRKIAIEACKYMVDHFENSTKQYEDTINWLERQKWSEYDGKMLIDTIDALNKPFPYALEHESPVRENIKWLKSIRRKYCDV